MNHDGLGMTLACLIIIFAPMADVSSETHDLWTTYLTYVEEGQNVAALYTISYAAAEARTDALAEAQGWTWREKTTYKANVWIAWTLVAFGWYSESEPWVKAARAMITLDGSLG